MEFEFNEDSLRNIISIQNLSESDRLYLKEMIEAIIIDVLAREGISGVF